MPIFQMTLCLFLAQEGPSVNQLKTRVVQVSYLLVFNDQPTGTVISRRYTSQGLLTIQNGLLKGYGFDTNNGKVK